MNEISPQQILDQIRALNKDLQVPIDKPSLPIGEASFGNVLTNTIDTVNRTQRSAGDMKRAFETNSGNAGLAEVMIAVQKADLSFRAMTEVRNKLVNAYQEIMNMPV